MAPFDEEITTPPALRYLSVVVMFAGLAVVAYLEATTEDGTVGILVIAAGLVLAGLSHAMASRVDG